MLERATMPAAVGANSPFGHKKAYDSRAKALMRLLAAVLNDKDLFRLMVERRSLIDSHAIHREAIVFGAG